MLESCPICNKSMRQFGKASFYDDRGAFQTTLTYCEECDLFKRIVPETSIEKHFYVASYVNLKNEEKLLNQRRNFFKYILSVIKSELNYSNNEKPKLLDFGSAYGHLLELAEKEGFETAGVEINKNLVDYVTNKGFKVYNTHKEIKEKVQVIVLLDSLYCVSNPLELLLELKQLLTDDGIICIRIVNRNWLIKTKKNLFGMDDFKTSLGDAIIGFSYKSLMKILDKAGFEISKVALNEKGKKVKGFMKKLFYRISLFISLLLKSKFIITPGIIVFAKNKKRTEV